MIEWQNPGRSIILASRSPRRTEILSQMGLTFETATPELSNENDYIDINNLEFSLQNLACAKAETVARIRPDALVLGADTVVVKGKKVFGKPSDRSDAITMLEMLSGTSHIVYTSTALVCGEEHFKKTAISATEVVFRALKSIEIDSYLEFEEYVDKAGAYAIQGRAMIFVERINGCFYNVMGLPVTSTIMMFKHYISRKESADV